MQFCIDEWLFQIQCARFAKAREVGVLDAWQVKGNQEKAVMAAQNSGLPDPGDGLQDAFRHAFWNALNARDIGVKAAPLARVYLL